MIARPRRAIVVLFVLGLAGATSVSIAIYGGSNPTAGYQINDCRTDRGTVLTLPPQTTGAALWQCDRTGNRLLVEAYASSDEGYARYGWWLLDRQTGGYSMVHENMASTIRFFRVLLSPDGRKLSALCLEYPPEVLTGKDVVPFRKRWVVMDLNSRDLQVIEGATRSSGADSWKALGAHYAWLNVDKLVSILPGREVQGGRPYACLGTLDVRTGEFREAIRETPGAGVRYLRRVADDKFIYCLESPERLEYYNSTSQPDPSRRNEGIVLKLADLSGPAPLTRVLPVSADAADLENGVLSPDGKCYAFLKESVTILNVENGKALPVDREVADLQQWHPDGTKLLGIMYNAGYPQDLPGVLVEIPVADVLAALQ